MLEEHFKNRAKEFTLKYEDGESDCYLKKIGSGQEGYVWEIERGAAIKVFQRRENYEIELKCYEILKACNVTNIEGFNLPQLLDYDDELLVIEMSLVSAPYILDFGKAHFKEHDFSVDVMDEYERRCEDFFGNHWDRVCLAIYELKDMGIFYFDARPGNINCDGLE